MSSPVQIRHLGTWWFDWTRGLGLAIFPVQKVVIHKNKCSF